LRLGYQSLALSGTDSAPGGALIDRRQLQEQLNASFEHRVRRDPGVELVSRGSYSQFREQYLADQRGADVLDRFEDNREHLGQLTSLLELGADSSYRTTVGLEQLFQVFDSERLSHRGNRYRIAGFGQLAWKAWTGAASGRTETGEPAEARFDIVPGIRLDVDSQFGPQVSPKLALRYMPTPQLELRASYGRGFRAPSFQELLLRFENPTVGYVVAGNPNLNAETSHGVDAGIVYRPAEGLELAATFFRNDLRNMITTVSVSETSTAGIGARYGYKNLTNAHTMGLESSAALRLSRILTLQLGHMLLYTWDGEEHREIEGRPRHRVTASLRLAHPSSGTSLVARAAGQLRRIYFPVDENGKDQRVVAPALWSVDMRVIQRVTRFAELAVGIENLLGTRDDYMVMVPFTLSASVRGQY
jgi:outer membrane receptor for ferrienterochelin and colicins